MTPPDGRPRHGAGGNASDDRTRDQRHRSEAVFDRYDIVSGKDMRQALERTQRYRREIGGKRDR
jgi:hypothetical protein